MHPDLISFQLRGETHTVHWYGVLMLLGMGAAIAVGARRAPRYGVEPFDAVAAGLLGCVGGVAGAWLLYALLNLRAFVAAPGLFFTSPGLVFYGGFLGAGGCVWGYARAYKVPLGALADLAAVSLPLGHAFGRVGCFLGGCCYGRPTRSALGVVFDPRTPAGIASRLVGPLHPVQLYEAAGLAAIALATWLVARFAPPRARGALFGVYVALYALLRLATEQLRGDFVERGFLVPGWLSTSQAIALAMLAAAAALLLVLHRRTPKGVAV